MHTPVYSARAMYTVSSLTGALCTCSVDWKCTHRSNEHFQCTLYEHISIVRAPTVYTVSAITAPLCPYIVHCKCTQRCTVAIMNILQVRTLLKLVHALSTPPSHYELQYCKAAYSIAMCTLLAFRHVTQAQSALPFMCTMQAHSVRRLQWVRRAES